MQAREQRGIGISQQYLDNSQQYFLVARRRCLVTKKFSSRATMTWKQNSDDADFICDYLYLFVASYYR
jgi:hypothetical protein